MSSRTHRAASLAIAVALGLTLVGATAVVARSHHRTAGVITKAVDRQAIVWQAGEQNRVYVKSMRWQPLQIPGGGCHVGTKTCVGSTPGPFLLFAKGPISLTFSGVFTSAAVEIRFRDGKRIMHPGAVRFRPAPGRNAFSFTFVSDRHGKRLCEGPELEWRSPSGKEVRLNRATIVVQYKEYVPPQDRACL